MELIRETDLVLATRLSTISLKEPIIRKKGTETSRRKLMTREGQRRRKAESKGSKEKRTESCPAFDKNCETISYRIYGNPKGEGFLIEARMFKGNEGKQERKKREKQAVYTVYVHRRNETS